MSGNRSMERWTSAPRGLALPARLGAVTLAMLVALAASAARGEEPVPLEEQLPGLHLLHGPWDGGTVYRESVLFVQGAEGKASARLLFDVEKVLAVHSATGRETFEAGRDYRLTADGSGLELLPGSRAPHRKESDFFLPRDSPHSIPHRAGHPETSVLFGGCPFFHDRQVEVTYRPRATKWTGYRPAFAGGRLKGILAKLKAKTPVTIAVSGDSISQGHDASGYGKVPPFMPPYPDLVAAQLEATYGAKVTLRNRAIAGWTTGQGIDDLDNLLGEKPDLVVIAYGMNDIGGRDPGRYKAAIATMLKRIEEADPAIDVILVASMIGNPEWAPTATDLFPAYRDALASFEGPGVALADMTALWETLMRRKRFVDMVGNGVNHPDDYGHRLYAQAILALLVDPALVPPVRRSMNPR